MEEVKKSKKKNKVASLLLALALILTCGVAGTIAQYQKSFGGTDTANVAKFNVKADTLGTVNTQQIDLFKTILDTKDAQNETDVTQNSGSASKIAPGTEGYFEVTLENDSDVNVEYALSLSMPQGSGIYTNGGTSKFIPLEFATYESTTAPTSTTAFSNAFDKNVNTTGTIINLGKMTADTSKATTLVAAPTSKLPQMATKDSKKVYICWRWAFSDGDKDSADPSEKQAYKDRMELDTAIGEAIYNNSSSFVAPQVTVDLVCTQVD